MLLVKSVIIKTHFFLDTVPPTWVFHAGGMVLSVGSGMDLTADQVVDLVHHRLFGILTEVKSS